MQGPTLQPVSDPLAPAAEPLTPHPPAKAPKTSPASMPPSGSPPKKTATSPRRSRSAPKRTEPTSDVRVDVYGRIPEPVAQLLDDAEYELKHSDRKLRGARQRIVIDLASEIESKVQLRELVADYRAALDADTQASRALFVRMPETVVDGLDKVVHELKKDMRRTAPSRQEALAALIWLRLASPSARADVVERIVTGAGELAV